MELTTLRNGAWEGELDLSDGTLSIACDSNAEIKNAALVVDGQPLALSWKATSHSWSASVEDVQRATLHVALRATAPIRDADGTMRVLLNEHAIVAVRYTLAGRAKVVPGRSAWHGPDALPFGVATALRLRLRNDGDADYTGGVVRVLASAGVNLAGDGHRVPDDRSPHLVVPVPALKVGAATDLSVAVKPCDPAIKTLTISAETELAAEPLQASFALDVETPTLKIEAHDVEAIRFGDVLLARAVISSGSTRSESATLFVSVTPGGDATTDLGTVGAYERRALFVAVPINDPAISEGDAVLKATIFGDDGRKLLETESILKVAGAAAARLELTMDEADDSSAHMLHMRLTNTGDVALRDVALALDKRQGLAAIRDSAELDGESILELDGSVPIFDAGIVIDRILVGQTRELTLRLRHNKGKALSLQAAATMGDVTIAACEINGVFANGSTRRADSDAKPAKAGTRRERASANAVAAPPETSTVKDSPESGAPEHPPIAAELSEEHQAATAGQAPPAPEAQSEERPTPPAPEPELVYACAVPEECVTLAVAGAPIGHHVAAALGLLPHGHTTDAQVGAAALQLSEIANQNLQLISLAHRRGAYGSSGYGIPANLLNALVELRKAQREPLPADDLDAMKQLIAIADVKGAASRDIHRWRTAVLEALDTATSVNDLSLPADASLREVAA